MLTSDERPPTIDSFQVDQDVYLAEENSVPRVCTDIVSWAGPSLASEAADKSSGSKRLLRKYHFAERGANLKYTPALEGMLGVALIYLQLLVKYTNQMPHVGELYRQSEIAKPSGSIRLPALFWMLWVRLKFLNTRIWQKTSKIATALSWSGNKDILVQTIESSIKTCETCRSSQELIADLADGVETLCVDFGVDPSIASLR
ncbi:Hypothetical protein NTJ_09925 [Nesidiocoris tenuis]|uniref:Uncharacterized protein n=1 Tax=Nesidiocoris tenuis TaxID=355587 RepID=A0ABN7B1R7_9HEMI|nr:Hypothetical protein NTJ_09925 [Nesidiocoris tenuis]